MNLSNNLWISATCNVSERQTALCLDTAAKDKKNANFIKQKIVYNGTIMLLITLNETTINQKVV